MTRFRARHMILAEANRFRRRTLVGRFVLKPYTARHLQRAVHVVRQNRLVSGEVLAAAGFNAR